MSIRFILYLYAHAIYTMYAPRLYILIIIHIFQCIDVFSKNNKCTSNSWRVFFIFLFNKTRYVNANIMRFYYFRFFVRAYSTGSLRQAMFVIPFCGFLSLLKIYKKKKKKQAGRRINVFRNGDVGDRLFCSRDSYISNAPKT